MFPFLVFLLIQISGIFCNTEKTIFLGPANVQIPLEHPTLQDLKLEALSPLSWSLRTHIHAEFPTNSSKYGQPSWYLLEGLQEGQRYEVRICWAATQPTSFRMETYDLSTVFNTPKLFTSLAEFSRERQESVENSQSSFARDPTMHSYDASTLFLQVHTAADYYTTNKTLMKHVPPVFVDIILDPFLFNILPQTLVPTVGYIVFVAIGSWFLSKYISGHLSVIARRSVTDEKKTS